MAKSYRNAWCAGFAHHRAPDFTTISAVAPRAQALSLSVNPDMNFERKRAETARRAGPVLSTNLDVPMSPLAVADEMSAAVGTRNSAVNRPSMIQTGDLVVDLETRTVSVDGKRVPLTGKEYCVFELLTLRKDIAVTKEMLLAQLYGGADEPKMKIIDVFVCHLRKKLAQATGGKHYIETVWGRGYRLRGPAEIPPSLQS